MIYNNHSVYIPKQFDVVFQKLLAFCRKIYYNKGGWKDAIFWKKTLEEFNV